MVSLSLSGIIERIVLGLVKPMLDARAFYPAKVISQTGSVLDVRPESPTLPDMTGVPLRGIPGVVATVAPGARVLIAFENGNLTTPIATLANTTDLISLTITATTKVTVNAPQVDITSAAALPIARQGDMVQVISSAPGTPAFGQIMSGNPNARA